MTNTLTQQLAFARALRDTMRDAAFRRQAYEGLGPTLDLDAYAAECEPDSAEAEGTAITPVIVFELDLYDVRDRATTIEVPRWLAQLPA